MSRAYLDPAGVAGAPPAPTIERVPAAVRKFGYYPDLSVMQAGDLILVRSTKPSSNVLAIERAQRSRHDPFDAQWIHAAAYLGEGSLVEIAWSGVSVHELSKYVGGHRLHVRRPLDRVGTPIDALTGYKIAVSALKMFKTTYDIGAIASIGWRAVRGGDNFKMHPKSPQAICSAYYDAAVGRVLERGAVSAKVDPFTPADLSASSNMRDVAVGWTRLR